jgi:hypothetical protein
VCVCVRPCVQACACVRGLCVCVCARARVCPSDLLRKMKQAGDFNGFLNSKTWYLITIHILVTYFCGKIFGLPASWRPLFSPRLVSVCKVRFMTDKLTPPGFTPRIRDSPVRYHSTNALYSSITSD